jgi:hypothetical protein
MLTPLGWRLVLAVVALLLVVAVVYLFVVTRTGQEALCGRVGVCIEGQR